MPDRAARFGRSRIRFIFILIAVLVLLIAISRAGEFFFGIDSGETAGVLGFLLLAFGCFAMFKLAVSDHKVENREELEDHSPINDPFENVDIGYPGDGGD